MPRIALSNTSDWKLKHSEQDIRGRGVQDRSGAHIGTIDRMIVNTDERVVDAVVLDDGRELPARSIEITDGRVLLIEDAAGGSPQRVAVYDSAEGVEETNRDLSDFDVHGDRFRDHHRNTYSDKDRAYEQYEAAYRFGYDAGIESRYGDRSYEQVESELRDDFSLQFPAGDYNEVSEAVRYGYTSSRRDRR